MRNFWIVVVFLLALLSSFGSAAPSINVGPSPALPSVNVTRFATIGDSYASGVGAGKSISSRGLKWKPNKNWDCSRFSNSYGRLVWKDPRLDSLYGTRDNREFDYKACTGAKARHVDQQLKKLGEGQYDVITLTVGGNEMKFSNIVHSCILKFKSESRKKHACEDAIDFAHERLQTLLPPRLNHTISTAITKLKPDTGRLYITGYPELTDEETDYCDNVSFALMPWHKTRDSFATKNRRRELNELTWNLNQRIKAIVNSLAQVHGTDRVVFVAIDEHFAKCGGRLCEEGVKELDKKRKEHLVFTPSFLWSKDQLWKDAHHTRTLPDRNIPNTPRQANPGDTTMNGHLKMLHPRSNGHRMIADIIVEHLTGTIRHPDDLGICPMTRRYMKAEVEQDAKEDAESVEPESVELDEDEQAFGEIDETDFEDFEHNLEMWEAMAEYYEEDMEEEDGEEMGDGDEVSAW